MRGALSALGALGLVPALALAHHSSPAVYDLQRIVEVTGELVDVAWNNPHVKLMLRVTDAAGEPTIWTIEANSPSMLEGRGIDPGLFRIGEQLRVAGSPARATHYELFVDNILLPDGREALMRPLVEPRWTRQTVGRDVRVILPAPGS